MCLFWLKNASKLFGGWALSGLTEAAYSSPQMSAWLLCGREGRDGVREEEGKEGSDGAKREVKEGKLLYHLWEDGCTGSVTVLEVHSYCTGDYEELMKSLYVDRVMLWNDVLCRMLTCWKTTSKNYWKLCATCTTSLIKVSSIKVCLACCQSLSQW